MTYNYYNPVKIKLGCGSLKELPEILGGRTAVLVADSEVLKRFSKIETLCSGNLVYVFSKIVSNPTIASITEGFNELSKYEYDVIIALGGGSTIDTAKGISILSGGTVSSDWLDSYLRKSGTKPANLKSKPIVAIPTTAGTGSEVTRWATIWDEKNKKKYSLEDEILYPEYALLDAELTETLPYGITLISALDALSHSMESIWNNNANPVSNSLAATAIKILVSVFGDNFKENYVNSREKLQYASLLAGMAFSNTKTAIAHSISYPLTGHSNIPHGLACSFTLPEIMKFNSISKEHISIIIDALGCSSLNMAIDKLNKIFKEIGVTDYLSKYSIDTLKEELTDFTFISPGRAKNNIIEVSQDEAVQIVLRSLSNLLS